MELDEEFGKRLEETKKQSPGHPSSPPCQGLRIPAGTRGWRLGCKKGVSLGGSSFLTGVQSCCSCCVCVQQGSTRGVITFIHIINESLSLLHVHLTIPDPAKVLVLLVLSLHKSACLLSKQHPASSATATPTHPSIFPLTAPKALCWETRPHHSSFSW